jgi:predicted SAM-dependent methyltransferase
MKTSNKLQLGCGKRAFPDFYNVDIADVPGLDLQWDLDIVPYPLESGRFEFIHAEDIIEHLKDIVPVIAEWHRLLKVGGKLWIRTNDADFPGKAWRDPTHKHAFEFETFDYWCPETFYGKNYGSFYNGIKDHKFKMVEKRKHNFGLEFLMEKICD